MKITRKKGIDKVRIIHNSKLFWIIIILIIILGFLIYFIVKNIKIDIEPIAECSVDADCVPACGCHPDKCVAASERGECPGVFCTQVCSGPLDCGAGSCGCVNKKCQVIPNG